MTSPAAASPPAAGSGAALAVLFVIVFINLVGFGLVVPLLPFFAGSLNAPEWQVTLMFSAYSLGQFFAEPFWGRLSDRIGRKPVLLVTTAANALGYLLLVFAPDIWTAILVRLFTGLGAGNISTIQGYVADVTPPQQRAGRMGFLGAAFGLGFMVGPAVGGLLARPELGHAGFNPPLYLAAAASAAASVGVLIFLKESRAKADPAVPRPLFLTGLKDARDNPVISRVLLVTFIYMAAFAGMEATFGLWAQARFGWGPREVGFAFLIVGAAAAVTQALISGRLARRFGEARVLVAGVLLFGLSLALQTLNRDPMMALFLTGLGAFGQSLLIPCVSALISRAAPPDRQGAMLGLNMAAGSASRITGPILAGALFSGLGANAPFLVGSLLCLPAAVMAVNAGRAFRREQARHTAT
jgi:MFS family permease